MVILKTSVCMQKAVLKSNNLQYNLVGWLDDGIWLSGCLFVCNRGGTYYSIMAGSRQGSLAKPLPLLFLTPRPTLSSHQHSPLVCLFWSGNLHCSLTSKSNYWRSWKTTKYIFPWTRNSQPDLAAQSQKFGIFEKKISLV